MKKKDFVTPEKFTVSIVLYKFIKDIVRDFNLTPEQEDKLHKIAQEDTDKLYEKL